MSLQVCTPEAIRVALRGACAYVLAAYMGSNIAVAQLEETQGTAPLEETQGTAPLEETQISSGELQSFRDAVYGVESLDGAYGSMLPEQLLSLGIALQEDGRHEEAAAVFKRGSHLARINNGLYSSAQIPYLKHNITSRMALGQYSEADDIQTRLFRVQRRNQANGEIDVDALLQQARWQRQAYTLGVSDVDVSFNRLLNMWDLNRLALNAIREREGDTSPNLLPPLYGMLRAQYLFSAHSNRASNTTVYSDIGPGPRQGRFNSYASKNFEMGSSIIRAIHEIQVVVHGEASLAAAQSRVMMGDWMLWHNAREPAVEAYSLAIGELAGQDDAQLQIENLLSSPTALPDMEGIRPLPPEVSTEIGGIILLEFGVSRKGRVVDVVRLQGDTAERTDEDIEFDSEALRLMRALRRTKFRPRYVSGEAKTTEKLVKAYAIPH